MSLAGVQNKLGVVFNDGTFWLPEGAASSTHILKPANQNPDFPHCPANEFFCMRLAQALELTTPDVRLFHFPEPIYLVRRFDRTITSDGIRRLHQIDLCQLLNKWSGYKYESHGGITTRELFSAIDYTQQPAVTRDRVLRWFIFNYLIGNNDAHAKNLSFLVTNNGISCAPFYDLLCVQAYLPESVMAMSINDENKPGWIEGFHWRTLAKEAGIPPRLMNSYLKRLTKNIISTAKHLLSYTDFTDEERTFIEKQLIPVIQQRKDFVCSALRQLT
jgi:serine/threonine-protein kinase HipA